MSKIYDIAPTAKFLDMWETAGARAMFNRGDSFIGVNHVDDTLRSVTKGKSTHRIKWLFSSKYRKWVKDQRESFVNQIEKELIVSFDKGNTHAFIRADMKLENDAGRKAESCMESSVFRVITQDLRAARANTGNEKAFLRDLSAFFHKTRKNVSECDQTTIGRLPATYRQPGNEENNGLRNSLGALDDTYGKVMDIPLPAAGGLLHGGRDESAPLFRLQIDLKRFPEVAHNPRVAAKVAHRTRVREKNSGSGAQNLNLEYDRSDPVVFSFLKQESVYATVEPNRALRSQSPEQSEQQPRAQTPELLRQKGVYGAVKRPTTPDSFMRFNRNAEPGPVRPDIPERTQEDLTEMEAEVAVVRGEEKSTKPGNQS